MKNRACVGAIAWIALTLIVTAGCAPNPEANEDRLLEGFLDPPDPARPDAFWPWLNGHADPARITAEMERFKAAGFSRLQIWDVQALQDPDGIVPVGPSFLSDAWLAILAHANREALRLDLELGLLAASGWNAGGTWVEPEQAGVGLFSSVSVARGPADLELVLDFPEVPEHAPRGDDGRPAYWRTIAVQALPVADGEALVPEHVVDLTDRLDADGRLRWEAPEGEWAVRWFVFANTGQRLIVPSPESDGLQIDFFDEDDTRAYFTYVLDRLESALGPLEDSAVRYLEVDSLELEGRRLDAWTEDILETFLERYGYDARPYLSLIDGAATAGELGERVLFDWTRLVSDLMIENHYRLGDELLRERGLLLAAEAGGPGPPIWNSCPVDALGALGAVGLMRGEFWPKQRSMYNVKEIACAAHTYGHTIVDAESFTSWRHWRDGPYYLKLLADQAFIDGLNHITFHTAPHGGEEAGLPGFAYHAGTHMGPNLVWWPMAGPFIDYLSRTSFLLQQGLPVADVVFYQGAGAPAFHPLAVDFDPAIRPAGYDYDVVDVRVLTGSMSVRDGRIVLPHGVSYAVLVLPDEESIDPAALRKIRELVRDGATVVGPRPTRANGLAGFPEIDEEVRGLADELWGAIDGGIGGEGASERSGGLHGERSGEPGGELGTEHRFGAGRVISGRAVPEVLAEAGIPPDFAWEGGDARTRLSFVHRSGEDAEIYFLVNDNERWEELDGLFRVADRMPEIWDPAAGTVVPPRAYRVEGGRTRVALRLPPGGSTFVVFRGDPETPEPVWRDTVPLERSFPASVDVAHGDTPNGPAWVSAGEQPAAEELIVYDLGANVDLGHVDVWNYQHQTRGLLTRGIREVEVSTSPDGVAFESLGRVEFRKSPEIGERDYDQRIPLPATGVRYVRLDVVSNWSDDWSGWTDIVGLSRIVFIDADGVEVGGVRVHEVSSGLAHDPATDDMHPPPRAGIELAGSWRLGFQEGRGAPDETDWPTLISWTESEDAGIRHFSGIAVYTLAFTPPAALLEPGAAVELDLGRVAGTARVFLNGEDLGVVWKPPYAVDVTGRLRTGDNELRVEVANTWHNRLVGDAALPPAERITTTNIRRPFTPETPLLESGLLGPVRLVPLQQRAAGQLSHDWLPEHPPTSLPLRGATGIDWVSTFGSPRADWVNKVLRLRDGSLVAAGFVDRADGEAAEWDAFAHKFDADGRPTWTKRFGAAGLDAVWSLQQGADGGVALAGSSETDATGSTDVWLLLLDGLGEPVRERRFGGAGEEFTFDVVTAADGGFLIVGETESSGAGELDVFLVRTDATGGLLWERTYGGPRVDRGFYGVAAPDGGFVIAGVTGARDAYDMLVLKVDDDGNEVWRQVIGGEGNDPNHGINLLPDGRIVVAGYTASWGSSDHDLIAVTLSPDGEVLSQEIIGGPGDDRVINSVTAADGGTWLIGYTTSFGDGDWDVMLARLAPDGHFEPWLGAIGTAANDHGTTLVETPDGKLIIGGYTFAPSEGLEPDLLLLAVDPDSVQRRTDGVGVRRVR